MRRLATIGSFAGMFLSVSPSFAQLSPDTYTWSAEVQLKQGGIERTTLIDARKKGAIWAVTMECAVVDKAFKQRHVQRFGGTAKWEGGLMLGTANNEMKFTIANRNDGDLAVITSGDFCASGKGYLGSGEASFSQNAVEKLGLADGWYCSSTGENVLVNAHDDPPYIGIDGRDCHDPVVANGRLTAKACYSNGGHKFPVSKTFAAQGETLTMDGVAYRLTPREKGAEGCAGISKASVEADPEPVMTAGHNGSGMQIGADDKIIYTDPKASIRNVVKPGTVLVEGRWVGEKYEGTAYAFKKGCPPAPYRVSGGKVEKPGQLDLVLRGAGPIRQGCEVVGYSEKSPHSRLVFDRIMSN